MMYGAHSSDFSLHRYATGNIPKPIGSGAFKSSPDTWFYISAFHDMTDELPSVEDLVALVARVHKWSMRTKFTKRELGFGVPTYLANIPNDNTYQDTWEAFFTQAMKSMYGFEMAAQGEDEEMDTLFHAVCTKVIAALLRPLETNGGSITSCLVHSDIWPGNCGRDKTTGKLMLFDSCVFWGHHEAELGPWRAKRYRLGMEYMERYWEVMGIEPDDQWEERNALYAL
jgi:fructosamine-3-kinase